MLNGVGGAMGPGESCRTLKQRFPMLMATMQRSLLGVKFVELILVRGVAGMGIAGEVGIVRDASSIWGGG